MIPHTLSHDEIFTPVRETRILTIARRRDNKLIEVVGLTSGFDLAEKLAAAHASLPANSSTTYFYTHIECEVDSEDCIQWTLVLK